jgi:hypothetical protein
MAFECGYTCLLDIATVLHNVSLVVPYHLWIHNSFCYILHM